MLASFPIIDAHSHFFSCAWLQLIFERARSKFAPADDVSALARMLGWQMPPLNPRDLAAQWVAEQDKHGVARQVLFAGDVTEAESLTAARLAFPDRLAAYAMIDPTRADARQQTIYVLHSLHMNGILLIPALHHFHVSDACVATILEEALSENVPVFIHFGQLRIPILDKLGIADQIDLRFSNPHDLQPLVNEFTDLNFIIPHFGCGRFEEALAVAAACDNVYFDTSSSNSWIKPPHALKDVFERSLDVLGAKRILFGTDSSFFPRGWRRDIFDTQKRIVSELGLAETDQALIFGGNISRLLGSI
jgi:predicted TIM-barrel fold metal-dependent hydrolase